MIKDIYQAVVFVSIVDAAYEKPERPNILEAKVEEEIDEKNSDPHEQELEVHERAENKNTCPLSRS